MDDLTQWAEWVGRRESVEDVIAPGPAERLAATLGRREPTPRAGDALPPAWHWIYFLEATPRDGLADDGHARRGGFLPPVTLPRRMWAGGRIAFERPLRIGEAVRRESEILSITPKEGRSGRLVFVTVRHVISGEDGPAIDEEHDIVYRHAPPPDAPLSQGKTPPADPKWRRVVEPDAALLFRFSALIFNAHRIHYDRDYVRDVEGYPGLLVHGPLTAILLLDLLRESCPDQTLRHFDYQAMAPLFDTAPFTVAGKANDGAAALWAETPDGKMAMGGTAKLELIF
jgi:3-methylfumaryl-CoA hydratase